MGHTAPHSRANVLPHNLLVAFALILTSASALAEDFATVTVAPFPTSTVEEFDPQHPPTNPPLKKGEAADAQSQYQVKAGTPGLTVDEKISGDTAMVTWTVKGPMRVAVSATETIRLPTDADEQLEKHEDGHAALDKNDYERTAKEKVEDAFRGLKGMKITGKGTGKNALEDARKDAGKQLQAELDKRANAAAAAIKQQASVLAKKYDALTNHGKNDRDKIDTAQKGIDAALAERAKAPRAGTQGSVPHPGKPSAGTAPDPAMVFFDPAAGALSFGGDLLLAFTNDPSDSILGRGLVQVEPMLVIGPHADGTIHLADTTLQILDPATGGLLMDALLYEPSYMPSTLPNYSGMIQGYLDIPPDFAGGISNTIGSSFLSRMQAASTAGEPTTFWFFSNQPLFDNGGNSLISDAGVSGALKLGVSSVPEPNTLGLLCSGLIAVPVWYWRRTARKVRSA